MKRSSAREEVVGDPRFFQRQGPFSLAEITQAAGSREVILPVSQKKEDPLYFHGVAPIQKAGPLEVSFIDNKRYLPLLKDTQAGAVVVSSVLRDRVPAGAVAIVCDRPYLAWARIAALFYPRNSFAGGIHPTAVLGKDVKIGQNVCIGPHAVLEDGVKIGDESFIGAQCFLGRNVEVGDRCRISPLVSVSHALIGSGVVLYPGVRIGQEGFGFAAHDTGFETIPQIGRVVVEDGVEIGANTTIDRGSMQDTLIGAGTRIDNLVQIGHNVRLGKCCIVVAQAGISGSTEIGDFVTIAAQAGLIGHIRIGSRARIGAQAGVMGDVKGGADVIGSPALPIREFFRNIATLRRLSRRPCQKVAPDK